MDDAESDQARRIARAAKRAAKLHTRDLRKSNGESGLSQGSDGQAGFSHGFVRFVRRERGATPVPLPEAGEAIDRPLAKRLLLERADTLVVSYPRSGRTWLSHMTTAYTARHLGCHDAMAPCGTVYAFAMPEARESYLRAYFRAIAAGAVAPLVQFLHLYSTEPFTRPRVVRVPDCRRYVLLLRDPRDVVVSHYHHMLARGRRWPDKDADARLPEDFELGEFVANDRFGMRAVIAYMDDWSAWAAATGASVAYYEDFVHRPGETLTRFLLAAGFSTVDPAQIEATLEETSFARLHDLEVRIRAAEGKPHADLDLRVRRGRIGGYRDEVDAHTAAYMRRLLARCGVSSLARYLQAP